VGCSITVDNSEKEGGETEMQKRGGGGRECTDVGTGGLCEGQPRGFPLAPPLRARGC